MSHKWKFVVREIDSGMDRRDEALELLCHLLLDEFLRRSAIKTADRSSGNSSIGMEANEGSKDQMEGEAIER